MNSPKLEESRRTVAQPDLSDYFEADFLPSGQERTFDIEIERMYVEKLRQQRQKVQPIETQIEAITKCYEEARQELNQKDLLMTELEKKLSIASDMASYKKKFDDLSREFKILERERDRFRNENDQLKSQLELAKDEKNAAVKELKACLNDTEFKFSEQLAELREAIDNKQRIIESIKAKYEDELKRISSETFKQTQYIKAYREQSVEQQHSLKHVNQMLNRTLGEREKTIAELTARLDLLQKRFNAQTDELANKQTEIGAMGDEYRKVFQKMKYHLRTVKKELHDRDHLISEHKENLNRLTESLKKSEVKHSTLSQEFKHHNKAFEDRLQLHTFEWSEERKRLLESNRDLKLNLETLTQNNNQLVYENNRLTTNLRQKETSEKVRNNIARAQQLEIDRVERLIRRF